MKNKDFGNQPVEQTYFKLIEFVRTGKASTLYLNPIKGPNIYTLILTVLTNENKHQQMTIAFRLKWFRILFHAFIFIGTSFLLLTFNAILFFTNMFDGMFFFSMNIILIILLYKKLFYFSNARIMRFYNELMSDGAHIALKFTGID